MSTQLFATSNGVSHQFGNPDPVTHVLTQGCWCSPKMYLDLENNRWVCTHNHSNTPAPESHA